MKELFAPKTVAVIGVSHDPGKIGYIIFDNLLSSYSGKVFGVNPNAETVLGQNLYKTILDIKEGIDLAIISVPAKIVPQVLESCGKKKVAAVIIISSGFSEAGISGKNLEKEVQTVAEKHGIRVLGPNCLGIINNFNCLNASFATSQMPPKYRVGIFSQSGAMGAAMLDFANGGGFGFSYFVSLGNKIDISEIDLLVSWQDDENVKVAVGYLEDIKDGQEFIKVAKKFTAKKPLIILKGGTTKEGTAAAHLHTAAMAGDAQVFTAAMADAGVILAKNLGDLFELAVSFSENGLPKGKNLAIISNAGGPSVLAADACGHEKVSLAKLSNHSINTLGRQTEAVSVENPIDLRGDATSEDFRVAFEVCENDSAVDGILAIVTPQAMTQLENIAWEAVAAKREGKKPIYVNFIGGQLVESAASICRENGIATFGYPERAVRAFRYQSDFETQKIYRPKENSQKFNHEAAKSILKFSGGSVTPERIASILGLYGIPMAQTILARNEKEAEKALGVIKPPVVMKISSPDITHKTDVGGVLLSIENEQEAREAYKKIIANIRMNVPEAKIQGVTVMQTAREGLEVIVGAKRDLIFGPVLMFGFGGIYVELISDFSTMVGPFDETKVKKMIESTAVSKILEGYRGAKKYNLKPLIDAMLGLAAIVTEHAEISQIEINPLVVEENGAVLGLDAKIQLTEHDRS